MKAFWAFSTETPASNGITSAFQSMIPCRDQSNCHAHFEAFFMNLKIGFPRPTVL
jgi:hypothetical protein